VSRLQAQKKKGKEMQSTKFPTDSVPNKKKGLEKIKKNFSRIQSWLQLPEVLPTDEHSPSKKGSRFLILFRQ